MEVFIEIGKGISTLGLIAISSVVLMVIVLILRDMTSRLRRPHDEGKELDIDKILVSARDVSDPYWNKLAKHYDAGKTEAENQRNSLNIEMLRTAFASERAALEQKIRSLIMSREQMLFVSLECIVAFLAITLLIGAIVFIVNWIIVQSFLPDYTLNTSTIFLIVGLIGIALTSLSEICCAIKLAYLGSITRETCHRYGYVERMLAY